MTNQQSQRNVFLVRVPVRVEVCFVKDRSLVAAKETIIEQALTSEDIGSLEQDSDGVLHQAFTSQIADYMQKELFPLEASDSPLFTPETSIKILIKGNIATWERERYLSN